MDEVFVPPTAAELGALMASDLVQDGLTEVAETGRAIAEATAPVETGHYRSRFRVEHTAGGVQIVNDDEAALAIEFGTSDTPAHLTVSRMIDQLEAGG